MTIVDGMPYALGGNPGVVGVWVGGRAGRVREKANATTLLACQAGHMLAKANVTETNENKRNRYCILRFVETRYKFEMLHRPTLQTFKKMILTQ